MGHSHRRCLKSRGLTPIRLSIGVLLLLLQCKGLRYQYEVTVVVDEEVVADGFGNHDGTASEDELKSMEEYLSSNEEAWSVGYIPHRYWGPVTVIPADTVLYAFKENRLLGPYESEERLREAYEGVGFRTPYVGVYVIVSGEAYEITKFFRAPGGGFSESEWVRMKIVP